MWTTTKATITTPPTLTNNMVHCSASIAMGKGEVLPAKLLAFDQNGIELMSYQEGDTILISGTMKIHAWERGKDFQITLDGIAGHHRDGPVQSQRPKVKLKPEHAAQMEFVRDALSIENDLAESALPH